MKPELSFLKTIDDSIDNLFIMLVSADQTKSLREILLVSSLLARLTILLTGVVKIHTLDRCQPTAGTSCEVAETAVSMMTAVDSLV